LITNPDEQQATESSAASESAANLVREIAAMECKADGLIDAELSVERFFATDHLEGDLAGRSVRGALATFGGQGAIFLLGLVNTAILARLLTLDDYGLVGMVGIVVGFVALFSDAGLSMATIQQKTITHAQVSTLFWLNVALGCVLAVILAAISPGIAWFFGRKELMPIAMAISLTFVLGGLTPQHQALMRRQMRFGTLTIIASHRSCSA
jgi:hypothetical protein